MLAKMQGGLAIDAAIIMRDKASRKLCSVNGFRFMRLNNDHSVLRQPVEGLDSVRRQLSGTAVVRRVSEQQSCWRMRPM